MQAATRKIASKLRAHPLHGYLKRRWNRYATLGLVANGFIWITSLVYLALARPVYTTTWALLLPGGSSGVSVNLPEIGQASSSSGTGMGSSTFDQRANYEYIFSSDTVLRRAAKLAGLSPDQFKKPRIKLLDNTTLMQFEVGAPSPALAKAKSFALYEAISERLNELRRREISQREGPTQKILSEAQLKLELAQTKLSQYKSRSGLTSDDLVGNLSSNIEDLRKQRAEATAQQRLFAARLQQLRRDLGLSSSQAADAFLLQNDGVFQQNLREYSEASASLKVLSGRFGVNHPRVVKERKRQESAMAALLRRSRSLLSRSLSSAELARLALASSGASGRDTLLQGLVTVQADLQGVQGRILGLDRAIASLEARLGRLSQRQSNLDTLKRDVQIAEAVFASTLTKLDLGQGELFSAYPLVQMVVDPELPQKSSSPKVGFVLAGAVLGSVFSSLGLWLLWVRKPWVKKLSKFISP
ncbi:MULTISPECIES: hypothetical protein [unclassified Synechococcus]|uniref:GumC family protein n=1 Tax=unclassified Synechococcus TaxID=2626047 RepID=UPI0000698FAA|nr:MULTISPECIES: hypothetical protein [unclassified Synechococcus]EAQ74180.1 hypothetical protein WH5701_12738 [Synechococcus sp. WH 5701]WFN58443.1 hypothetical protein N4320_11585 [Synechococcus sp. CCFWC 502]